MKPSRSKFASVAMTLRRYAPVILFPALLTTALPAKVLAGDGGWGDEDSAQKGLVQGWGSGPITAEVQPGTTTACDASHQCEVTVSGQGDARAGLGRVGRFDLQADVTIDLPDGTTNGFGGQCYPATGSLSLTGARGGAASGMLVVDIQGVNCAVGASATLSAIDATYVVDGANSTGEFAGASGTGTVRAATDSSQSPQVVEFAFNGSLLGANPKRSER